MNVAKYMAIGFVTVLVGCGSSKSPSDGPGNQNEYNGRKGPQAKQQYYEEYYKKFQLSDRCTESGMRWYEYSHIFEPIRIDAQNKLYVFTTIYMFGNGTYTSTLETRKLLPPERSLLGGTAYELIRNDRVNGKWSVNEEQINFTGLGQGRAIRYNSVDAIDFTFEKVAVIPALEGQTGFITGASSSWIIEDLEKPDCR